MKEKFPSNFMWGGASWAVGFEGNEKKVKDVWDVWYEKEPTRFFNQNGPNDSIDFYSKYKEYIALLKDTGFNSFRFSISWSRFYDFENKKADSDGLEFYTNVIDECHKLGIKPIVCLWHFDLPNFLQEKGGWLSREVIELFVDYTKVVFEHFGDKIELFFVHNEVGVHPEMGYIYDAHVPNHVDFNEMVQCAYNLLLAQAKVIKLYKSYNFSGKIGTILNPNPVYPRSNNIHDVEAARITDIIYERTYLDASIKGYFSKDVLDFWQEYNLTPVMQEEDYDIFNNNVVQFLGVNYYQPKRVKARESLVNPNAPLVPKSFYDEYVMPGREFNFSRGWEIYPQGIYDTLMRIKNEYGNIECMIGENGMGVENEQNYIVDGMIQDDYRIDFFDRHLYYVAKAIEDGCNCQGYHIWAPFDNWSPINAFKNRYGIYQFDKENKVMIPKKSQLYFKNLLKGDNND